MSPKGFTLIELMIVVAIIGILSMFAVAIYMDYARRTHVAEGVSLASSAKIAVVETFATRGVYPSSNIMTGLALPSKIRGNAVDSVTVGTSGIITVLYNSKVFNQLMVFIPTAIPIAGEAIKWDCTSNSTVAVIYRPTECR